jgi:hypothetical protein
MISKPSTGRTGLPAAWLAALAAVLAFPPAAELFADGSPKNLVATHRSTAITIDGVLSEQAWEEAVPVGGFLQYDPVEGAPATERTSVRALFDDDNVYFGIFCHDGDPSAIDRQLTRRDRTGQSDRVSVIIDSYHAHATAFLFSVSASGVQSDGVFSYDGLLYDVQWDAVWEAGAAVTPGGWGAEIRIPFSALRFSLQEGEYVWGLNVRRYISRKNETDEWVMVPRNETQPGVISSVSKMGHLSGLTKISPPLHIEILPYQVTSYGHFAEPEPFEPRQELDGSLGLDAKYGVTNNVTLDLTVNPDFGQVEVDQAVLNLTVFDTYYPEKRPFFLEGASVFTFGNAFDNRDLGLFYSRRIGREPTLARPPSPGTVYEENPRFTTILGAAKLTGRTDGGLTFGAISALTDEEVAVERDASGNTGEPFIVEPRAGYNVLRVSQDIGTSSRVGFLGTVAAKEFSAPAWSGGVDWRLRFDDDTWLADGYLAFSKPSEESGISGRKGGSAGRLALGNIGDDHLLWFSTYDFSSRDFSVADLGFYEQPREHGGYTQGTWRENAADGAAVRRYALTLQPNYRWNWDGYVTTASLEFEPAFEFTNFWTLTFNATHGFRAYDDASRGINGLYLRPEINAFRAVVDTDPSKSVIVSGYFGFDDDAKEMQRWIASLKITLRVTSWMDVVPMVTLSKTWREEAWAIPFYEPSGNNLFGDRDVDQLDFSLRGTVAFSRKVTAQFFTQVFIAKGTYGNFRELTGPETFVPVDFDPANGTPDFNDRVLNANIVLRWEYLPGSTIYLVWTHERAGSVLSSDGSVTDEVAETFKLPVNNVILAKISYWWSL